MYENKHKPLITRRSFAKRLLWHALAALLLVGLTLALGVIGHSYFANMKPIPALVASVTLSSGLGLSILPDSTAGQLFASLYGIFCGYIYLATSSIILAPILHRILHKFHLAEPS